MIPPTPRSDPLAFKWDKAARIISRPRKGRGLLDYWRTASKRPRLPS